MAIYKVPDLSKLSDCIALSESGKCTRLTVYKYFGEKCSFKRTHKEEFNSIQCAYQRLASLNSSVQNYIATKYYGGYMPWNEECNI
ncbi:hypothetical protein FDF31_12480 [Clostridium sporogenes]|nr:hypothetical protein [Clostridium sporogenes]NFS26414.1 hypothetical protein [Clostridium sporogenes]